MIITSFGEVSFKFYIKEYDIDRAILIERETYWINYFGGIESDLVYNYHNNKECNSDMRQRISDGQKRYVLLTGGERYKGKNNPMYRKTS